MVLNLGRQLGSHQTEMSRRTWPAENAAWPQYEPQKMPGMRLLCGLCSGDLGCVCSSVMGDDIKKVGWTQIPLP